MIIIENKKVFNATKLPFDQHFTLASSYNDTFAPRRNFWSTEKPLIFSKSALRDSRSLLEYRNAWPFSHRKVVIFIIDRRRTVSSISYNQHQFASKRRNSVHNKKKIIFMHHNERNMDQSPCKRKPAGQETEIFFSIPELKNKIKLQRTNSNETKEKTQTGV